MLFETADCTAQTPPTSSIFSENVLRPNISSTFSAVKMAAMATYLSQKLLLHALKAPPSIFATSFRIAVLDKLTSLSSIGKPVFL